MNKPLWTPCEDCDDFWCNYHDKHTYDCDCPTIDEFCEIDFDPYSHTSDDPRLATLLGQPSRT